MRERLWRAGNPSLLAIAEAWWDDDLEMFCSESFVGGRLLSAGLFREASQLEAWVETTRVSLSMLWEWSPADAATGGLSEVSLARLERWKKEEAS